MERIVFEVSTSWGKDQKWRFLIHRVRYIDNVEVSREFWAVGRPHGREGQAEAWNAASDMLNGEWDWA